MVPPSQLQRFNEAVISLSRSEFPLSLQESTAKHFFEIPNFLQQDEVVDLAVFEEDGSEVGLQLSKRTALLALQLDVKSFRDTLGSVQGKIHSLYKEADPPYFILRELSSGHLVKCFYKDDDYAAIVRALEIKDQVVHVKGVVLTDTRARAIKHVRVTHILVAEQFGFAEVEKFLSTRRSQ